MHKALTFSSWNQSFELKDTITLDRAYLVISMTQLGSEVWAACFQHLIAIDIHVRCRASRPLRTRNQTNVESTNT